jgi:mycothiol synthase
VTDEVDVMDVALPDDLRAMGYRTRPATMDDLDELVAVHQAVSLDVVGHIEDTAETLRADLERPKLDLRADTRVVLTPDGRIVGYGEVGEGLNSKVEFWTWMRVHPDHRGKGIAEALYRWIDRRAREAVGTPPPDERVYLQAQRNARDTDGLAILRAEGYEVVRGFWRMGIDLDGDIPAPAWPEGIAVRTMRDGEHDDERRAIYGALNDAFADHWEHHWADSDEGFERWWHLMRYRPGYDPDLWFLAVDGEEIAGMSLCYTERTGLPDTGWVSILGVRQAWRRRGIALALLHHSFRALRERGLAHAGLGVDAESTTGATQLYEKAGMHVISETLALQKELWEGT